MDREQRAKEIQFALCKQRPIFPPSKTSFLDFFTVADYIEEEINQAKKNAVIETCETILKDIKDKICNLRFCQPNANAPTGARSLDAWERGQENALVYLKEKLKQALESEV